MMRAQSEQIVRLGANEVIQWAAAVPTECVQRLH
jgi:hypothetical protein